MPRDLADMCKLGRGVPLEAWAEGAWPYKAHMILPRALHDPARLQTLRAMLRSGFNPHRRP